MLDIKFLREDFETLKDSLVKRGIKLNFSLDDLRELDLKLKSLRNEISNLREAQNKLSKEISILKKNKEDVTELVEKSRSIGDEISRLAENERGLESQFKTMWYQLPNILSPDVPFGTDETQNVVVNYFDKPKEFDFEVMPHWDLGKALGLLDIERAGKVTGSRFSFHVGLGARFIRALLNFMMDIHKSDGFIELWPPYLVNEASMYGTGQMPKFRDELFKCADDPYFLIPTAEVPVTNYFRDEILLDDSLPIRFCAYSACFRREAGSYGKDVRGIIRQHQFDKVELVVFCRPEESMSELNFITEQAQKVLRGLKLPYRVIELCSGDLGFGSAKTYDIEVYMAYSKNYREISSCSNFTDFQARRANIRYKPKNGKARYVHTLNGSGLAIGRTLAAIYEYYQDKDGSLIVPDVLIPYIGMERIESKNVGRSK
ncbi:seryl-tRNA synthetase [Thermodesulfobium acidiphilum]|uniref:Serine--tRNA ligase n=1 Tax=Thermodesulfobium acidiphilum TaxID=1794699 RepID=A0A2R4W2J8_THEAF|nr:serine--tRNA ligase [Thermodesulfobium acidiphilum]AWB10950.1 seryl-tRNA synthetase [Thermodesulfobium acidiphilum]